MNFESFLICLLALPLLVSVLRRGRYIFGLWDGVVVCMIEVSDLASVGFPGIVKF